MQAQDIIDGKICYNYTIKDGLASNQVLYSFQDSKGVMWFATGGGGVSKFDGVDFKTFDLSNGLLDNEVFIIYEDYKNRIWFGTWSCRLSYYEDGEIYSYQYNETIKNALSWFSLISGIHVNQEDDLSLFFHDHGRIKISSTGKVDRENDSLLATNKVVSISLAYEGENLYSSWQKKNIDYEFTKIHIENLQSGDKSSSVQPYLRRSYPVFENEDVIFFSDKSISKFNLQAEVISKINIPIELNGIDLKNVFRHGNNYWLLTFEKGIIVGEIIEQEFHVKDHIFERYLITHVSKDKTNGLWLSTLRNGVIYIPYPEISSLKKMNSLQEKYKNISTIRDNLYAFSVKSGEVIIKRKSKTDTILLDQNIEENHIKNVSFIDSSRLFIQSKWSIQEYKLSDKKPKLISKVLNNNEQLLNLDPGEILIGGIKGVFEYKLDSIKEILSVKVRSMGLHNNNLLIGTNTGYDVYEFNKNRIPKKRDESSKLNNYYISDFENYKNGVWIAAKSYGIAYHTDSIEFVLNRANGLQSLQINSLKQDADTLWVSTDYGLSKIILDKNMTIENVFNYDRSSGLSSNQIIGVETTAKNLFISTDNGIDLIEKKKFTDKDTSDAKVEFTQIDCKDCEETSLRLNDFEFDENDLTINYHYLNYKALGKQKFRYKLLPIDSEWKFTSQRKVAYNNLSPDNYTFTIEILNKFGNWNSGNSLQFNVSPPFWQTWWLRAIVAFSVLGLLFAFFKFRENSYRRQIEYNNKIKLLQEKALRAQVNPHFIFNTLNSIQSFVLKNDFESSNRYITKFSRLMRTILNQSDKVSISIKEEIKIIKFYLEIEQMRFDHKFDFEMDIHEKLNLNQTFIPSMLIQPYVENAIWHGLASTGRKGKITIKVDVDPLANHPTLQCKIIDNGIGRKAAEAIKKSSSKKRRSVGMNLTKERLDILNKDRRDYLVKVVDLEDKNGKARGTEIILSIPYKSNANENSYHRR